MSRLRINSSNQQANVLWLKLRPGMSDYATTRLATAKQIPPGLKDTKKCQDTSIGILQSIQDDVVLGINGLQVLVLERSVEEEIDGLSGNYSWQWTDAIVVQQHMDDTRFFQLAQYSFRGFLQQYFFPLYSIRVQRRDSRVELRKVVQQQDPVRRRELFIDEIVN